MANLTAKRDTKKMLSPYEMVLNYAKASGVTLFVGGMCGLNTSGEVIRGGGAAAGFNKLLGRVKKVTDTRVEAETGIFKWVNNGSNTVVVGDIGKLCYAVDDQTVSMLNTNVVAGRVIAVDSDGVWVLTEMSQ
jgi:hypothetical protein